MRNAFDFWDKLTKEQKKEVRKVERKYGNNRWWESKDVAVVIYYQSKERMMMMSYPEYKDALEIFLERPVCDIDFAFNKERVDAEIDTALKRKKAGIGQSEEQREAAHKDYRKRLDETIRKKLPKDRIIRIEEPPQNQNGNNNGIDTSGYDGWRNPYS